jgi:hypothetical protein
MVPLAHDDTSPRDSPDSYQKAGDDQAECTLSGLRIFGVVREGMHHEHTQQCE